MGLFFGRKRQQEIEQRNERVSSIKVIAIKGKTHKTAEQAKRELDKLNRVLAENHITLQIHIAAGGK